jgi:hypothetical protein
MAEEVKSAGYTFPYLYDESQTVAKAYRAACTPDFFVFDANKKLVYRGQFDDSRPKNESPVTGADLRRAVDAAAISNGSRATRRSILAPEGECFWSQLEAAPESSKVRVDSAIIH